MTFRALICGSLLLSFFAAAATGTTLLPLSDRDLLDTSDAVVIATVSSVSSQIRAAGIMTDAQLRVEDVIKGELASRTITVSEFGGSAGGRMMIVEGAPVYTSGQRVLAFLKQRADGTWFTAAMSRGHFRETRTARGEAVFVRDAHGESPEAPRLRSQFIAYLRGDSVKGSYRSADAAVLALQPRVDGGGSEYVYHASPPAGTKPIRWRNGETGLVMLSINGTQPGIDTSGLQADADAWTNVSTAGISISTSGSTPAADPNSPGSNTIFLNYNSAVPAGLCEARACTVWWLNDAPAFQHTYGGETFYDILNAYIIFKSGFTQAQFNALAKHEFGHSIGLRHSDQGVPSTADAIMASQIDVGFINNLRPWDIDAVSTVYGSGAPCSAPQILTESGDGAVNAGDPATLSVTAQGSAPLNYQWYLGNPGLTNSPVGTNSPNFTTPPVTSEQRYWVKVGNSCGSAPSRVFIVTPRACETPRIIDHPTSRTVSPGTAVTLQVFVSASLPITFQWFRGQRGDTSNPLSSAAGSAVNVTPATTTAYWVRVTACGVSVDSNTAVITVEDPSAPRITALTAAPTTIALGASSTLSWTTVNATAVAFSHGIGAQALSGSVAVQPEITTTYIMVASGPGGVVRRAVTVIVTGPRVVLGSLPRGLVQREGQPGATDTYTMKNVGEEATTVTLAPSGDFFTVSPTSFSIAAGADQTITVTGLAKPAGFYGPGTITATGRGVRAPVVPVRMLVAAPPVGTVDPRFHRSRLEVSSPSGQNANGFVDFTNAGTATMAGIAVADVDWIIPQSGLIIIPPGQTVAVSYMIDSTKRPDGDAPIGAVIGKITLIYFLGTPPGMTVAADTPGSKTIGVTLVHVAKPSVSNATPPPLTPGELALFVSGLRNKTNSTGDLLLANRTTVPLSSLQLFVQGSGAQSLTASIPQLVGNSSLALPGLLSNVFSSSVTTGTAQVRGADAANVTVGAIQTNAASPAGTYSTSLPVFRSDRSVASSSAIYLSGVLKQTNAQTDLFIQETSGVAGTYTLEFLDNAGRVISSSASMPITAFGLAEHADAAPANAVSARITNNTGSARLSAYGLVTNGTTGDSWVVTDPAAGSTTDSTYIVPIFAAPGGAETFLYTTNRSTAPITVTIDASGGTSRRRVTHRGGTLPPTLQAGTDATATLAPAETVATTITATSGYLRVSAPAATLSTVGRSIRRTGTSAFGTGLPAVPISAALSAGEGKRFAGIDDASSVSRATLVPSTFRTHLALVETNGAPATVRVTVQFSFSGGSLVSSSARVFKDYPIAVGQYLLISDVATDVIGPSRNSLGDLRNITLDVDVMSGSGRVIPFVEAVENGSGDILVRIE